jgi:hypothetical protein
MVFKYLIILIENKRLNIYIFIDRQFIPLVKFIDKNRDTIIKTLRTQHKEKAPN